MRAWRGCGICRALCVINVGDVIDGRAWDRLITQPRSVHPGGPPFLWATCLSSTLERGQNDHDGPKAGVVSH